MSKYLISLTPMGSYFFGGERSFIVGDEENELTSYIVESNLFPQQTSLLGMLRFWLLRNSEAFSISENKIKEKENETDLIDPKDVAIGLIGESSFCVDKEQKFGVINGLDFCFLQKYNGNDWIPILPAPLDYQLDMDFSKSVTAYYNGKAKKLPYIEFLNKAEDKRYTDKDGLVRRYISQDGNNSFEKDEIFKKDQRIGINRDIETGKTDDNALYKQIFYRLEDGYRFAFIADINQKPEKLPADGQIVELGGDSSKFILNYNELEDVPKELYIKFNIGKDKSKLTGNNISRVILLSDTYMERSDAEGAMFSITEHIPFRFLSFEIKKTTNYSRGVKTNPNKKNNRYSLFKRGSVFYFDDEMKFEAFKKAIDNNKTFQQIGYNKYEFKKSNNHEYK